MTTVRDLGDRHYRTLDARALDGLPRVVAAGPPLTEPGGHCHYLGGEVSGVDGVRRAVAEHVERGVDVIKVMASGGMLTAGTDAFGVQFSDEELRAVVEAAHGAGLQVLAHAHSLAGIRHAVAAGVDGIEHFTGLTAEGLRMPDEVIELVAARRHPGVPHGGRRPGQGPAAGAPGARPAGCAGADRAGLPDHARDPDRPLRAAAEPRGARGERHRRRHQSAQGARRGRLRGARPGGRRTTRSPRRWPPRPRALPSRAGSPTSPAGWHRGSPPTSSSWTAT